MNCKNFEDELPNLLLDPESQASPAMVAHMKVCPPCKEEFATLQGTFYLLDEWSAPEPSAYFDQKLAVRIREEQAAPRMNWFERWSTRLRFNTGRQFRPALAGAFALALAVGGGTVVGVKTLNHPAAVQASAAIDDLQILDRNEQAFQEMDQLQVDEDGPGDEAPPAS